MIPPLQFPVACTLDEDCFVQQLPDMNPGPGAVDPYCGDATYDGHDGVDIRLKSLADMRRGVAVVAAASGTVLRVRDAMEDRLVLGPAAKDAVDGRECGNGVVVDQGDGVVAQYCHLRRGSVVVLPGEKLEAGDKIGEIGASGLAAFPHVHLSLRRNGTKLDPLTQRPLAAGCAKTAAEPGFLKGHQDLLRNDFLAIMSVGLSGTPVDYDRLVVEGPPPSPTPQDVNTIGYAWIINLQKGDQIRTVMTDPSGEVSFDRTSSPLESHKAAYSTFSGLRRSPAPGLWTVEVSVLREGEPILRRRERVSVH